MENITECEDCTKEFEQKQNETLCPECKESTQKEIEEENKKLMKYMRE